MLKTISPIDNTIYVERPYASSSEIENTLKLSEQSKLIWKNTSLDERKKLVSKLFKDNKLSMFEKDKQYVLTDQDHILWVIGIRFDNRKYCKVNSNLKISLFEK